MELRMINILYWNAGIRTEEDRQSIRGENVRQKIIELILENNIDIVILAEYTFDMMLMCDMLSVYGKDFKVASVAKDSRVKMLVSMKFNVELIRDSTYYFICSINNALTDFLIAGLHFPSKRYAENGGREIVARQFMGALCEAQSEVKHKKTIITGDFNADPFEDVMLTADHFHALPYADIVENKRERKVFGKNYQMFYNPMWNFLGDLKTPHSTCYYDSGGAVNFYKHIFDQVLVSADMVKNFDKDNLKIVTETGSDILVDGKGIPNRKEYSDHLPIVFGIKEDA